MKHSYTTYVVAFLLAFKCFKASVVQAIVSCPYDVSSEDSVILDAQDPKFSRYSEVSGLAISPFQKAPSGEPVMYGINDSGGGKLIGIFDSGTGERLLTLSFRRLLFKISDPESLTIGTCGSTGMDDTCLYIGDVGDNKGRENPPGTKSQRNGVPYGIIKIKEPNITFYSDYDEILLEEMSLMQFDYLHPTSPSVFADSEAIFMDHTGWGGAVGDIYVVTKFNKGSQSLEYTRIFRIPVSAWPTVMNGSLAPLYSPVAVGRGAGQMGKEWTRADMTLSGNVIALGDLFQTHLFLRCPGESVAEALNKTSCHYWNTPWDESRGMIRFETFAWTPDGNRGLTMSECAGGCSPPMAWTTMGYNESAQSCPNVAWSDSPPFFCRSLADNDLLPDAWCTAQNLEKPKTPSPTPENTPAPIASPAPIDSPAPTVSSPTNMPSQATPAPVNATNNDLDSSTGVTAKWLTVFGTHMFLLVTGFLLI